MNINKTPKKHPEQKEPEAIRHWNQAFGKNLLTSDVEAIKSFDDDSSL